MILWLWVIVLIEGCKLYGQVGKAPHSTSIFRTWRGSNYKRKINQIKMKKYPLQLETCKTGNVKSLPGNLHLVDSLPIQEIHCTHSVVHAHQHPRLVVHQVYWRVESGSGVHRAQQLCKVTYVCDICPYR